MATPYIGEIRLVGFNFAPEGWASCEGQLLPIPEYETLFALIGTTYGGDGVQTFALPNLQSRVAIHMGDNLILGETAGVENVTITTQTMPAHTHALSVSNALGTKPSPVGDYPAVAPEGLGYVYEAYDAGNSQNMNAGSISTTGSGQPHSNIQPYLALNFIIALYGIFPSQG